MGLMIIFILKKTKKPNGNALVNSLSLFATSVPHFQAIHPSIHPTVVEIFLSGAEQTGDGVPTVTMLQPFSLTRLLAITFGHA